MFCVIEGLSEFTQPSHEMTGEKTKACHVEGTSFHFETLLSGSQGLLGICIIQNRIGFAVITINPKPQRLETISCFPYMAIVGHRGGKWRHSSVKVTA